jgi:hypothetical protein
LNPTALTLRTNRTEVYRNHPVTLTGELSSGATPVADQQVTINAVGVDGEVGPTLLTVTTDDAGRFLAKVSLSEAVTLQASTARTSLYEAANAAPVTVDIAAPETTTLRMSADSSRDVSQPARVPHTFAGQLLDSAGDPVPGRRVELWRRDVGNSEWLRVLSTGTDETGGWQLSTAPATERCLPGQVRRGRSLRRHAQRPCEGDRPRVTTRRLAGPRLMLAPRRGRPRRADHGPIATGSRA